MKGITQFCTAIALALTLSAPVFADPPEGKGKQDEVQGHPKNHDKDHSDGYRGDSDSYRRHGDDERMHDDKGENHGQIVAECSHRANQRNLKGKDRKAWTEWCEERGSRHHYDYRRYSTDRNCYQRADNKGLSGDRRRKFINDCLDRPNRY